MILSSLLVVMSEIRTFKITGAAADYAGNQRVKRTRAKKKEGGFLNIDDITIPPLKEPIKDSLPPFESVVTESNKPVNSIKTPDTRSFKVELKQKTATRTVKLHPKRTDPPKKKDVLHKSRKILLGVKSLHKRITHARKVQKKMKEIPIDKLKQLLIQKKLIKATSKAPESILRQIAADSQILQGKAL